MQFKADLYLSLSLLQRACTSSRRTPIELRSRTYTIRPDSTIDYYRSQRLFVEHDRFRGPGRTHNNNYCRGALARPFATPRDGGGGRSNSRVIFKATFVEYLVETLIRNNANAYARKYELF